MATGLSPAWTTTLPQASTRDPLRVDQARGSIRNRLFPHLSAVASRTRLRYISFLVWCLDNRAHELEQSIELFEIQFLLGSMACSDEAGPMSGSGFVGVGRDVGGEDYSLGDIIDQETPQIDISSKRVRLHSGSQRYSDRYARMANDLGLVEPESDELTALGEEVAAAYNNAVNSKFTTLVDQAQDTTISAQFMDTFPGSGCACSLSEREKQLYRRVFLGLYDREHTPQGETLSFTDAPPDEPANLDPLFDRYQTATSTPEIESVLAAFANARGISEDEGAEKITKYERFVKGEPTLARGSFLFVLGLAAQHNAGRENPAVGDLQQVADIWAVHDLARQFVAVNEHLLALLVEILRVQEPISPQELSRTIVQTPAFSETLESVPTAVEITTPDTDDPPTGVWALRQAATYGEWHLVQPGVSFADSHRPVETVDQSASTTPSWNALRENLEHEEDQTRLSLDRKSPWTLFQLFDQAVTRAREAARDEREGDAVTAAGEATALAALLFGRWQTWHDQFLTTRGDGAVTAWVNAHFDSPPSDGPRPISQSISPRLLWEFPYEFDDSVEDIMAAYLESYIIRRYIGVMYRKYEENGRAPTFLTLDETGRLYFEAPYTTPGPNPNIYKQVVDVLCELGLIETNSRNDICVTDAGRTVVDRLCETVPLK